MRGKVYTRGNSSFHIRLQQFPPVQTFHPSQGDFANGIIEAPSRHRHRFRLHSLFNKTTPRYKAFFYPKRIAETKLFINLQREKKIPTLSFHTFHENIHF
ncbi:hypothetical protein FHS80_000562 [Porphyromonas circumdentaria]|nr:hypothetical protein [Porphyromonas circumdentaria]